MLLQIGKINILSNGQSSSANGLHFVFLLDGSGSMSGKRWKDLQRAVIKFVHIRSQSTNEQSNDIFSVIYHSKEAELIESFKPIKLLQDVISNNKP